MQTQIAGRSSRGGNCPNGQALAKPLPCRHVPHFSLRCLRPSPHRTARAKRWRVISRSLTHLISHANFCPRCSSPADGHRPSPFFPGGARGFHAGRSLRASHSADAPTLCPSPHRPCQGHPEGVRIAATNRWSGSWNVSCRRPHKRSLRPGIGRPFCPARAVGPAAFSRVSARSSQTRFGFGLWQHAGGGDAQGGSPSEICTRREIEGQPVVIANLPDLDIAAHHRFAGAWLK